MKMTKTLRDSLGMTEAACLLFELLNAETKASAAFTKAKEGREKAKGSVTEFIKTASDDDLLSYANAAAKEFDPKKDADAKAAAFSSFKALFLRHNSDRTIGIKKGKAVITVYTDEKKAELAAKREEKAAKRTVAKSAAIVSGLATEQLAEVAIESTADEVKLILQMIQKLSPEKKARLAKELAKV